ncbi:MAG: AI-2E family transporter [Rhodospirillales bacterium]|nr:AI-2E family transporter [Rhodospirillales bacterium]
MSTDTIAHTPAPGEAPPPSAAAAGPEPAATAGAASRTSRRAVRIQSFSVTGLFVLAAIYTIHFGKAILMPVVAAVVLYILLWPAVRLLNRFRVPTALGAVIVVAGLLGVAGAGIYVLADPASAWLSQAPQVMSEVQAKIKAPVGELTKVKEKIEGMVEPRGGGGGPDAGPQVGLANAAMFVLGTVQQVGASLLIITALLFLLLASGTMFQEKLVRSLPRFRHKKQAVMITNQIQKDISAYLGTVAMINTGLGLAIGLGLYAIGMPNAALWGTMAALLNFVPYIGFAIGTSIVFIVGLLTFDTFAAALMAPAVYTICNAVEANAVTPILLSRRLTLNAVVVFLAVLGWGWLWGVSGALLAVPLLAMIKVIADHVDGLGGLSEFLGSRDPT